MSPRTTLPRARYPKCDSYRDIVEGASGVRCPNIFGVRIPNNGAILTAAIGHQVVHVALPRHVRENVRYILKKSPTAYGSDGRRPADRIWSFESKPRVNV